MEKIQDSPYLENQSFHNLFDEKSKEFELQKMKMDRLKLNRHDTSVEIEDDENG